MFEKMHSLVTNRKLVTTKLACPGLFDCVCRILCAHIFVPYILVQFIFIIHSCCVTYLFRAVHNVTQK